MGAAPPVPIGMHTPRYLPAANPGGPPMPQAARLFLCWRGLKAGLRLFPGPASTVALASNVCYMNSASIVEMGWHMAIRVSA